MNPVLDGLVLLAFIGRGSQTDIEVDCLFDVKEGLELIDIEIEKGPNMGLVKDTLSGPFHRLLEIQVYESWLNTVGLTLFYESNGLIVLDE